MKKYVITVSLILALFAAGCSTLIEDLVTTTPAVSAPKTSNDPLNGYVLSFEDGYPGGYKVAKVIKPASNATNGEAEVIVVSSNEKIWTKVFNSHPAVSGELVIGEIVLYQGSGYNEPDKDTLINTIWYAGYITDVSELYKNQITVGSETVTTRDLRIPEMEVPTF